MINVNRYFVLHEQNTPQSNKTLRQVRNEEELYDLDTFIDVNKKYNFIRLYNIGDGFNHNICINGAIHYLRNVKKLNIDIKDNTYMKHYRQ
jgi:hypothetical protein